MSWQKVYENLISLILLITIGILNMKSIISYAKQSFLNLFEKINSQQELVSRANQLNYFTSLTYLPDPDPVLRAKGKDISVYRELLIDSHLSAVLDKRKYSVQCMNWEVSGNEDEANNFFTNYFNNIDTYNLIGKILDCIYYGYQPFVIFWDLVDGKRIPRIEDRPQEYFFYDTENRLRIRTKFNEGILADEFAFIVARYKPEYLNPYGERVANKTFWPVIFKKGGIKFWLKMTEKYGMPFAVGKLPRGRNKKDADSLAAILENMVQDAVAVINDDENVEILEASGKSSSTDLYERLVDFMNKEISKAVLTVTNTVELQGGAGSYAASQTQKQGEDEKSLADKNIVQSFMNKLIQMTYLINFGTGEAPKFILYRPEDVDKLLAERDEILTRVGVKFTSKYIQENYNLQKDDFEIKLEDNSYSEFKENGNNNGNSKGRDKLENLTDNIPPVLLQLQIEQTLKPVFDLIKSGSDYNEVMNKLVEIYPDMKSSQLESLLEKAMFTTHIWGRINEQ